MPWRMHASLIEYYEKGGIFPAEGSADFARKLLPVIYKRGGRVLVGEAVKRIILTEEEGETKRAVVGIEMASGEQIKCCNVVSTIGVQKTYETLLPATFAMDRQFRNVIDNVRYSDSFVFVFVGLDGSKDELHLPSYTHWVMNDKMKD